MCLRLGMRQGIATLSTSSASPQHVQLSQNGSKQGLAMAGVRVWARAARGVACLPGALPRWPIEAGGCGLCVGNAHLLLALPGVACSVQRRLRSFSQAIWRIWANGGAVQGRSAAIADQQLDVGVSLLGRMYCVGFRACCQPAIPGTALLAGPSGELAASYDCFFAPGALQLGARIL